MASSFVALTPSAAPASIVVDVACAVDDAHVKMSVRVLGRSHALDNGTVDDAAMRRLLRALGSARICPGVGQGESADARWREGFDSLATAAVMNAAARLGWRSFGDLVIDTRAGGELLRGLDCVVAGVPSGPRFRSEGCELVEREPASWAKRRSGACDHCDACDTYLKSLLTCAGSSLSSTSTSTDSENENAKYRRHDYDARDPARAAARMAEIAAKLHATQDEARRMKAQRDRAIALQVCQSETTSATCKGSKLLTTKCAELQQSAEFDRLFPKGTVRRFLWDDQMANNSKVAEGKRTSSFRCVGCDVVGGRRPCTRRPRTRPPPCLRAAAACDHCFRVWRSREGGSHAHAAGAFRPVAWGYQPLWRCRFARCGQGTSDERRGTAPRARRWGRRNAVRWLT